MDRGPEGGGSSLAHFTVHFSSVRDHVRLKIFSSEELHSQLLLTRVFNSTNTKSWPIQLVCKPFVKTLHRVQTWQANHIIIPSIYFSTTCIFFCCRRIKSEANIAITALRKAKENKVKVVTRTTTQRMTS